MNRLLSAIRHASTHFRCPACGQRRRALCAPTGNAIRKNSKVVSNFLVAVRRLILPLKVGNEVATVAVSSRKETIMPTFTVHFEAECAYAEEDIVARTPKAALAKAHQYAEEHYDDLLFLHYDADTHVISSIVVRDAGGNDCAEWLDDESRMRGEALDLLNRARLVVACWETGNLAAAVRELAVVVARAEGRAA